jgi:hypothetical protein
VEKAWLSFFSTEFWVFIAGFYAFIFLQLFSSETIKFLYILEHELLHVLASILLFKPVVGLNINIFKGGHVKIRGESIFIALTPYIIPLFATIFFLSQYIIQHRFFIVLAFLFGAAEAFYLFRLKSDVHFNQSDFQFSGKFLSILTLINLNLIIQPTFLILFFKNFSFYTKTISGTFHLLQKFIGLLL